MFLLFFNTIWATIIISIPCVKFEGVLMLLSPMAIGLTMLSIFGCFYSRKKYDIIFQSENILINNSIVDYKDLITLVLIMPGGLIIHRKCKRFEMAHFNIKFINTTTTIEVLKVLLENKLSGQEYICKHEDRSFVKWEKI